MPITFDGELTINITLDGEFGQLQYFSDYKLYPGNMTVTPEVEAQTLQTDGLIMPGNLVVEAIPSNFGEITYSGRSMNINAAEQHDVSQVNVTAGGSTESFYDVSDATLNSSGQMPRGVVGYGVDGARITGNVPEVTSADMTISGRTVTAPAGFYAEDASVSVQEGSEGIPVAETETEGNTVTITPSVTNTEGYIEGGTRQGSPVTVSVSDLVSGTYTVSEPGTADVASYASVYVPEGTEGTPTLTKTIEGATATFTPSVTNETGWITGSTIQGIPMDVSASELVSGTYVVTSGGTKDVASYANVSVPYATTESPQIEVGEVTNHSVRLTPRVGYTSGWVSTSTDRGDVTVLSAADLVSGSQTITENDTYNVVNLAEVVVNVAGQGELQTKSASYTPTTSQQTSTILPDTGFDGMDEVNITINAIPLADAAGAISSTQYYNDNGQRKWRITPAIYAEREGWIPEGESGTASPQSYNAVPSGTVITPSTSSQTIGGANYMMEGAVTVNAMPNSQGNIELTREYVTENNTRKYEILPYITVTNPGYIPSGTFTGNTVKMSAIPTGTTVTPTESQQTIGGSDYVMEGAVTVDAIPIVNYYATSIQEEFTTKNSQRYCELTPYIYPYDTGYIGVTEFVGKQLDTIEKHAVPTTTITPTESVQTVGGYDYIMEGAVTINAIPSNYVGSGITQRSSSDLSISGNVVTAPAGYYQSAATYTLTNGNNIGYGITDGTIPRVGIAKIGSAEIGA